MIKVRQSRDCRRSRRVRFDGRAGGAPSRSRQGEMLRRLARRQERLRRGRGHDLRRNVQAQLSGQCLEICRQGHLREDQDPQGHRLAEAGRTVTP